MQLIGLNGKKRSGKDTSYEVLKFVLSGTVVRAAFADKMKIFGARSLGFVGTDEEMIATINLLKEGGHVSSFFYDETNDRVGGTHINGRQYIQDFGHRAREVFGDDFWINQILPLPGATQWSDRIAAHDLALMYPHADYVVITDVRYPNEARRIKALGGMVIEIVRPELEHDDAHASEQTLPRDLVDAVVLNDGDVNDLAGRLDRTVF